MQSGARVRNTLLILRREYLERIRTKSFLISTLLFPSLIVLLIVVPGRMTMLKAPTLRHIVVAAPTEELGQAVKTELERTPAEINRTVDPEEHPTAAEARSTRSEYRVDLDLNPTEHERALLSAKVAAGAIDGYLWLPDDAKTLAQATYYARETSDYMLDEVLQRAVSRGLLRYRLAGHGISTEQVDGLLTPVQLQTITLREGKERPAAGLGQFLSVFVLILLLYFTLVIYGVAVMRSIVEEKSSRVMEVMLSAASPKQMMAGKLLGVGAVGLTQILIWMALGALLMAPGVLAFEGAGAIDLPLMLVPAFAVYFVLGYMLYSALFAALGAIVNSDQEASQLQLIVTLPLIVPMVMLNFIMRQPNAPFSVWMSMVPLFSPVLMYVRIVVQTPPMWQIALSLAILLVTIYGVLVLCSRIYRVGILMYGKKPSVSEVLKWIRYA
jgi:ABC-2 type transport system permease protein